MRIVFAEGIRRGLASHSHRRLRQRTVSVETVDPEHSPSGDSEEMVTSPKQSTINIMNNIKRKIMSKPISHYSGKRTFVKFSQSWIFADHHHKLSNESVGEETNKGLQS